MSPPRLARMKSIDLNLLPTLQILLRLRNVSRTAEHLQLSQPATSAALSRLRRYFDDELLVRDGRHYKLTPLAQDLVPLVDDALQSLERVDPARSRHHHHRVSGGIRARSDRSHVLASHPHGRSCQSLASLGGSAGLRATPREPGDRRRDPQCDYQSPCYPLVPLKTLSAARQRWTWALHGSSGHRQRESQLR